jgi:uncharacterized protein
MTRPQHISSSRAGIGLRTPHYQSLLEQRPSISFLEVHSENFFGDGGQPLRYLARFREDYPVSTHGVGLSLGTSDALDSDHLRKLKRLVDWIEPALVSEHLCWVGVNGRFLNDLLPIPHTEEALDYVVGHVGQVQDFLGRQILVENVSSYLQFVDSTIPEWEFVREVAKRAGCKILLDVNNIYVNAINHGFDADTYLDAIEPGSVGEIHLAGFQDIGDVLIDTHGSAVCSDVWRLYERAIERLGPVPTLIEWDTDIPSLDVLLGEAAKADRILSRQAEARHAT